MPDDTPVYRVNYDAIFERTTRTDDNPFGVTPGTDDTSGPCPEHLCPFWWRHGYRRRSARVYFRGIPVDYQPNVDGAGGETGSPDQDGHREDRRSDHE